MGYLKTILTYRQPSEAEVDKAFLESDGLEVCLMNPNTSRDELGAPFYAVAIAARFVGGSPGRLIERRMQRVTAVRA